MSRKRRSAEAPISLFSFQDIICSICGIMILVALLMALELITRKAQSSTPPTPSGPDPAHIADQMAALEKEKSNLEKQITAGEALIAAVKGKDPREIAAEIKKEEARRQALAAALKQQQEKPKESPGDEKENDKLRAQIKELENRIANAQKETQKETPPFVEFVPSVEKGKTPILVECSGKGVQTKTLAAKPEVQSFIQPGAADPSASVSAFREWAGKCHKESQVFFVLVKPSAAIYAAGLIGFLREADFGVGYEPFEEEKTAMYAEKDKP